MITIKNLTKITIDKNFLKRIAKIVLKGENIRTMSRFARQNLDSSLRSEIKKRDISIVLVQPAFIKKLNKKYRKINNPTDILSFGKEQKTENRRQKFPAVGFNKELGEIIICPQVVKRNAKKFKSNFKNELALVLIHGILHLLRYEHKKNKREAKEMKKRENYYLSKI